MQKLLLNDLQDLHGASLGADTAGDTLGGGAFSRSDHNLHGADLYTLTAGGAELLVDHVNTGLGILGDCASFANLGTLTALDADHRLGSVALGYDSDAGQIFIEFLVECVGASANALQASHTFGTFFNSELLHSKKSPLFIIFRFHYTANVIK